jgi:hypothetical protein
MTNANENTTQVKKMEYSKYAALKKDLEIYFSKIIKGCFKDYFEQNYVFEFSADFQSHRLISELLEKHGFEVYGMNVNMDGFQLLLDFSYDYLSVDNFPFTRLAVDFKNDGNYSVYLGESSFDDDWSVHLEDEFNRFWTLSEPEFINTLNEIKNTHLMLKLKS